MLNEEARIPHAQAQLGFTGIASPMNRRVDIRQINVGKVVRAAHNATIAAFVQ